MIFIFKAFEVWGPRLPAARRGGAAVLALWLAACTVGPEYVRPPVVLPDRFGGDVRWHGVPRAGSDAQGQANATAPSADEAGGVKWWTVWRDPVLDSLEDQAWASNQSIAAAVARYDEARAIVAQSQASLLPSLSAQADASHSRRADFDRPRSAYVYYRVREVRALVDAQWEIDLWGRAKRDVQARTASAQADAAKLDAIRLSVSSALAAHYLSVRAADLELDALRAEQHAFSDLVTMTQAAKRNGLATDDDVLRAHDALSDAEARVASAMSARAIEAHAVSALLGMSSTPLSIAPDPSYRFALPDVEPVLPSALLERRPDIVEAEQRMAAANARIGVEQAAYFPDLLLGASVGGESMTLASLLSAPTRIWSLGPSISLPLFEAGRTRARVQAARAEYDAAVAHYRATVIAACREVEDELARQRKDDAVALASRAIMERDRQLEADMQRRRRAGLANDMDVANAQIVAADAARRWRASVAAAALTRVALVKDIGGGWRAGDPPSAAAHSTK